MQKREVNMLEGSLWKNILLVALPLAASSILQQLFNSADVAVVGHFAGSEALAAVGANAPVISLFVNIFTGLAVGSNVLIANALGAGDEMRASKGVHTSMLFSVYLGIAVAAAGFLIAPTILRWIAVPKEIMDAASLYLKIYVCGIPLVLIYNFEAAIFRAKGDTRTPLMVLLYSGGINLVLNLIFVAIFHMNVEGVAIATVISNAVSAVVLLRMLVKTKGPLQLRLKELAIDGSILVRIIKVGLPTGIQGCMFSISNVVVQSGINSLGPVVIAANSASLNYEYFGFYSMTAFSATAVTFVGQNYGAGNKERCKAAADWAIFLNAMLMVAAGVLCAIFAYPCMKFFTMDPAVIELGVQRIRRVFTLQWINAIFEVQSGAMRGLGKSMLPATICAVGICGFRITWLFTVFRHLKTYDCLLVGHPLSWVVTAVAVGIAYHVVMKDLMKKQK